MLSTFPGHDLVILYIWICLFANVKATSTLSDQNTDNTANGHVSPRVIKLMVIAALLFVSALFALYIYRKCKPRMRAPPPMYNIPHSTLNHPAMGTRPNWSLVRKISVSSISSSSPLIRMPSPSERTIVLEEIVRPTKAHTKARLSGPTVGIFPSRRST